MAIDWSVWCAEFNRSSMPTYLSPSTMTMSYMLDC